MLFYVNKYCSIDEHPKLQIHTLTEIYEAANKRKAGTEVYHSNLFLAMLEQMSDMTLSSFMTITILKATFREDLAFCGNTLDIKLDETCEVPATVSGFIVSDLKQESKVDKVYVAYNLPSGYVTETYILSATQYILLMLSLVAKDHHMHDVLAIIGMASIMNNCFYYKGHNIKVLTEDIKFVHHIFKHARYIKCDKDKLSIIEGISLIKLYDTWAKFADWVVESNNSDDYVIVMSYLISLARGERIAAHVESLHMWNNLYFNPLRLLKYANMHKDFAIYYDQEFSTLYVEPK